jgi:hypothetical protein
MIINSLKKCNSTISNIPGDVQNVMQSFEQNTNEILIEGLGKLNNCLDEKFDNITNSYNSIMSMLKELVLKNEPVEDPNILFAVKYKILKQKST